VIDVRIFTEPQQGATYDDILAFATQAERSGFSAFFRSDHYLAMGNAARAAVGPTDAWTTLAGLARETSTIRLGTLLTAGTFRLPGPLAITVAQVDAMSGGRVEFGIGAGWFEAEHRAYGIDFVGSPGDRLRRLEEELAVIIGLWETPRGETFSFSGEFFTLVDSPALPKPVQHPRPPVIIGGKGLRRTPAIAARYADEFNIPFPAPGQARSVLDAVDAACVAIGRDPGTLRRSITLATVCGDDVRECERRAEAIGRELRELRENGIAGTPDEVVEAIAALAGSGYESVYLQLVDITDVDHVAFIGERVLPLLGG
jgi:F420-dependent oxidoreductase-like protein